MTQTWKDWAHGAAAQRAGDSQRATPDSVHESQTSITGCLLFVVSSLRDEFLERHA